MAWGAPRGVDDLITKLQGNTTVRFHGTVNFRTVVFLSRCAREKRKRPADSRIHVCAVMGNRKICRPFPESSF